MSMDAAGGTQSRRRAELLVIWDITGRCRMAGKRAHLIRHYGLFAGTVRAGNIERVRQALAARECAPAFARGRQPGTRVSN